MNSRKFDRQLRALARFPKSHVSRKGKRTEQQWKLERETLVHRVTHGAA